MNQPLFKTKKSRNIILLVALFGLCSGFLPIHLGTVPISIVIFLLGFLILLIVGYKEIMKNSEAADNPFGINTDNTELGKNDKFLLLLGAAMSFPAFISLIVKISFF